MKQYFVTWDIDITAESHEDAARKAAEIQRDPDSTALVFTVRDVSDDSVVQVDLLEEDANEVILPVQDIDAAAEAMEANGWASLEREGDAT